MYPSYLQVCSARLNCVAGVHSRNFKANFCCGCVQDSVPAIFSGIFKRHLRIYCTSAAVIVINSFFRFFIIVEVNYVVAVNNVSFCCCSSMSVFSNICISFLFQFTVDVTKLHERKTTFNRPFTSYHLALTVITLKLGVVAGLVRSAVWYDVKETICSFDSAKILKVIFNLIKFARKIRNTAFNL